MVRNEAELIETSRVMKQIFRHLGGQYVAIDDADGNERIHRINQHLLPDKFINKLKEDLGEKYEDVIKLSQVHAKSYVYCKHLRQLISEQKDEKKKKFYLDKLRKECEKISTVDLANIIIFHHMIKRCDLQNLPFLHPSYKSSKEQKQSITLEENQ